MISGKFLTKFYLGLTLKHIQTMYLQIYVMRINECPSGGKGACANRGLDIDLSPSPPSPGPSLTITAYITGPMWSSSALTIHSFRLYFLRVLELLQSFCWLMNLVMSLD